VTRTIEAELNGNLPSTSHRCISIVYEP